MSDWTFFDPLLHYCGEMILENVRDSPSLTLLGLVTQWGLVFSFFNSPHLQNNYLGPSSMFVKYKTKTIKITIQNSTHSGSFKIQFIYYLDNPHFAMFKTIAKWQEGSWVTAHKNPFFRMKFLSNCFYYTRTYYINSPWIDAGWHNLVRRDWCLQPTIVSSMKVALSSY